VTGSLQQLVIDGEENAMRSFRRRRLGVLASAIALVALTQSSVPAMAVGLGDEVT
jgi:hypothetical protein